MGFVGRARSSVERGDPLRAIVTLMSGLRRDPNHEDAMQLLVELIRDTFDGGGIEHEIAQVLSPRTDRQALLTEMVDGLRARGEDRAADKLLAEAEKKFMPLAVPAPTTPPHRPLAGTPAPPESPSHRTTTPIDRPRNVMPPARRDERDRQPAARREHDDEREQQVAPLQERLASLPIDVPPAADSSAETRRQALADEQFKQRKQAVARERAAVKSAKRRRLALMVIVVAVVAGVVAVAVHLTQKQQHASALAAADDLVAKFDRFDPAAANRLADLTEQWPRPEFQERATFLAVLDGDVVEVRLDGWETAAGLAASAISALRTGDLENALALVTKTERLHPNALPTLAARALLAAHRGDAHGASRAANAGLDKYPSFALFHEVLIRVAAMQLDATSFDAAVARLATVRPAHPYTLLQSLPDVRAILLGPMPTCAPIAPAEADAFLMVLAELSALCGTHDAETAKERAIAALAADEAFTPARIVLGAAFAAEGDGEAAAVEFTTAAHQATSRELRLLLQAVAPIALVGAGRTDLAAPFTTPFPKLRGEGVNDKFDDQIGQARHENLRASALGDVAKIPWSVEALYARAEYFAARDQTAMVRAMLQELQSRGIEPQRAAALSAWWAPGEEVAPEADALTRAMNDARTGAFADVLLLDAADQPSWSLPIVLSLRADAHVALGTRADALAEIDGAALGLARWPWRATFREDVRTRPEPAEQLQDPTEDDLDAP